MAIEQENIRPWERQPNESEEAFEAFDIYAKMGSQRSIAKTANDVPNSSGGLGKDKSLLERWSSRYNWVSRAAAWDRYEARNLNEAIVLGRSEMRQRVITQSKNLQSRVANKILNLKQADIDKMTPYQAALITRIAIEIEMKARDVTPAELESGKGDFAPTFVIEFIPAKPPSMIQVRMPDGVSGYIPPEQLTRFMVDHPEAVVVQDAIDGMAPIAETAEVAPELIQ